MADRPVEKIIFSAHLYCGFDKKAYLCAMNLNDLKEKAVGALGFERLNAMQEEMLGTVVSGQNVLLLSPTGSGKTVAFLLPLMALGGKTLVIVPSRELAQQIGEVARKLGLPNTVCYGGHDARIEVQRLESLQANADCLVIGTPGRLKDHIERQRIVPKDFSQLVLDEYDKSLELGFEEEMQAIISRCTGLKLRILTSATHATPIAPWINFKPYRQLDYTVQPEEEGHLRLYRVASPIADKLETLRNLLLSLPDDGPAIVFSNYRESAERIAHYLADQGIDCALYHGGMEQDIRDKALIRLRAGCVRVLSATDLAARGLDIPEVRHIIHYHLPASEEVITHRNGRTARAGADGTAYLIVGPGEFLPEFIDDNLPYFSARKRPEGKAATPPAFTLVYIGRGKKEKISKGDIVGFFTHSGGIDGSQLGKIYIMDHCSYCAIRSEVAGEVLERVKGLKIKGEKTIHKAVDGN